MWERHIKGQMSRILFIQSETPEGKIRAYVVGLSIESDQRTSVEDVFRLMQNGEFNAVFSESGPSSPHWSQIAAHFNGAASGSGVVILFHKGQEIKTMPVTFLLPRCNEVGAGEAIEMITEELGLPDLSVKAIPSQPGNWT